MNNKVTIFVVRDSKETQIQLFEVYRQPGGMSDEMIRQVIELKKLDAPYKAVCDWLAKNLMLTPNPSIKDIVTDSDYIINLWFDGDRFMAIEGFCDLEFNGTPIDAFFE